MSQLPATVTARYRRDPDGWIVEIAEQPRIHSCGESLAEARRMIRDALATWVASDHLPEVRDLLELPRSLVADDEALARIEGLIDEEPTA